MIERDDLDTIRYFFLTTGSVCLTDWTPDLKTTFTLSTKNGEYFVDFDKVVRDLTDPKKEGTAEYRIAEKFLSTICTLIPESHSVLSCLGGSAKKWEILKDWSMLMQINGPRDLHYHQLADEFIKSRNQFARYSGYDNFSELCEARGVINEIKGVYDLDNIDRDDR